MLTMLFIFSSCFYYCYYVHDADADAHVVADDGAEAPDDYYDFSSLLMIIMMMMRMVLMMMEPMLMLMLMLMMTLMLDSDADANYD